MIRLVFNRLLAFRRREDGNATVEFAIVIPAFMLILLSTVELGLITIRQSMLERALDQTVRDIRLGTGSDFQHDDIRDSICDRSGFISDCDTSLRLEMILVDPFAWTAIDDQPDCVNSVEDVQPVRSFISGASNVLMFLRACMKFDPVFPNWGLGDNLGKDGDGRVSLFASSAFVQEPR